jgi:hypothetical protein
MQLSFTRKGRAAGSSPAGPAFTAFDGRCGGQGSSFPRLSALCCTAFATRFPRNWMRPPIVCHCSATSSSNTGECSSVWCFPSWHPRRSSSCKPWSRYAYMRRSREPVLLAHAYAVEPEDCLKGLLDQCMYLIESAVFVKMTARYLPGSLPCINF